LKEREKSIHTHIQQSIYFNEKLIVAAERKAHEIFQTTQHKTERERERIVILQFLIAVMKIHSSVINIYAN
jgi:vacuolar-type H+-ATPase subunit H